MSSDWDIESYRNEYENEDHWELKKRFMMAHKDKFSEDELVSLTQVFWNIEFLGCRYPEQTMIRVAELAKGVVEQFREQRKNSLKRTFVTASEAASAKMKGLNRNDPPAKKQAKNSNAVNANDFEVMLNNDDKDGNNYCKKTVNSHLPTGSRISKYGGVKTFDINLKSEVNCDKTLGNFVLFLTPESHPVSEIIRSANINSLVPRWEFENDSQGFKLCKLYFNDILISTGSGENNKISKEKAAVAAIAKLKESYYTVQVKSKFYTNSVVSSSDLNLVSSSNQNNKVEQNNIGKQLMKLMGWGGGGLGVKEQGIEEPIMATVLQVDKKGFGYNKNDSNLITFRKNANEYIRAWLKNDSKQDLVFSSEFSLEERKIIHEIAKNYSLKSRSYGKDSNRHLVVSHKVEPWDIVQTLIREGGSSDKYELLHPIKQT